MDIEEVLNLDISKKSLKKIESYLNKEDNFSLNYHKALAYKAYILYNTDSKSEAFNILLTHVNSEYNDKLIAYLDVLIDIYLELEDYAKVNKYIELKKDNLSALESYKHTFDLIKYYVKRNDVSKAKSYIYEILNDDIDLKNRVYVTRILLDYAYEESNLIDFNRHYSYLEDYYKNNNITNSLEEIYLYKLKLLFNNSSFIEVLKFIDNINLELLSIKTKIIFYTYHIKTLIKEDNLRKASILDATYEVLIKENKDIYKEETYDYYNTTLELYTKLDNIYSINYVNDILAHYTFKEVEVKHKTKSKFKEYNEQLVQNEVVNDIDSTKKEELVDFKLANSDKDIVLVSNEYKKLNDIIDNIINIDPDFKFREILRLILSYFNKSYKFEEAYMYIESDLSYHYKNNKVYDKKVDFDISKTINYRTKELGKEIVLHNLLNTYYNVSIITNEVSIYNSVISFPIFYNLKVVGSLTFYFQDDLIDNFYEFYKLIYLLINEYYQTKKYIDINNLTSDIVKILEPKIELGFKTIDLENVYINVKGINILNINTNELELNDFYNLILSSDRYIFKEALNDLLINGLQEKTIKYHLIDNKYIEDNLYLSDGNIIYSSFKDITYITNQFKLVESKVTNSNFLDVYSYKQLSSDYIELFKNKDKTLCLIDSSNFSSYTSLYGFEFGEDLISGFANLLTKYSKDYDYTTYHLEGIKFILILNYNDKRRILKNIKELLKKLVSDINQINKRVTLKLYSGVYKSEKKAKTEALKDYLDHATEALIDAKSEDIDCVIYSCELYNKSYFQDFYNEIEISEAIDKNKLKGLYTPIYNVSNNKILGYTYNLSLNKEIIDSNSFERVIRNRNLEYQIDKYLIEHVVIDLKSFYSKCGYFINVFVSINSKTLLNEAFIPFLNNLFNFYKVSASLISFIIDGEIVNNKVLDILKKSNLSIGTNSIDNIFKYDLDTIYLDNSIYSIDTIEKMKLSLLDKRIIILNLSDLNLIDRIRLVSPYISTGKDSIKYSIDNLILKSAT